MFNLTVCANVSVDLSDSSIRYSTHPHLLVFLAIVMCLLAAFIVGTNIFFIVVLVYSRYRYRITNVTDKREVLSDHSKIVSISFYSAQLIVGAFCLPLSIVQVISNGRWTIGHTICTVRIFVECLTELVGIYHLMCTCLDFFFMIRYPLRYRLLTSRTGYGMVIFSWATPVMIFVFIFCMGWHTDGIEDTLSCLRANQICANIFSQKFLFFTIPSSVLLAFILLIAMSFVALKEINRAHQRRNLQKNLNWFSEIKCKHSTATALDDVASVQSNKANKELGSIHPVINKDYISTISCETKKGEQRDCDQNNVKATSDTYEVNKARNDKKRKAFSVVITMATVYSVYLFLYIIIAFFFVFKTRMFPLWVIALVVSLRYIHAAFISIVTFTNKPLVHLMRTFLKAFL
ncbi:trace amine-associated receptor 13c [Biomphalaria pfeifferi]|uniref:Trace amine-associated receptor 13c n=1 Tax=Biomphalaria pfeifferi TaxID=112525 RepID=A0AAD8C441_BIOPF|nr:trace amine-associated receptor 13c [Biomphalaria pfeifferi]